MKGIGALFAVIVLLLWLASATYIAAPGVLPAPPMGGIPTAFLGVILFIVGILLVVVWADMAPEMSSVTEVKSTEDQAAKSMQ